LFLSPRTGIYTRHPEERSDKVGNRDEGSIRKPQKNRPLKGSGFSLYLLTIFIIIIPWLVA
ncbi:MAG: hypothetical protein KXJ51_05855, partial [Sediminibacterium sp.]|nr:hypothetical protein [Sediminibacterium sp.]